MEASQGGGPNLEKVGARRVEQRRVEPRRVEPRRVEPRGGAPKGGGPKISRFFFPLPPENSFFCARLEFSGCCVKRGFTPQPGSPNMHISGPRPSKRPPKFNEKTPREGRKERIFRRKREKKSEILGGPGKGCPGEGRFG